MTAHFSSFNLRMLPSCFHQSITQVTTTVVITNILDVESIEMVKKRHLGLQGKLHNTGTRSRKSSQMKRRHFPKSPGNPYTRLANVVLQQNHTANFQSMLSSKILYNNSWKISLAKPIILRLSSVSLQRRARAFYINKQVLGLIICNRRESLDSTQWHLPKKTTLPYCNGHFHLKRDSNNTFWRRPVYKKDFQRLSKLSSTNRELFKLTTMDIQRMSINSL